MKLTVERKPASIVVLDITADDDEFAEAMTKAYRKVSKDIQIPGFRKGKAPRSMVERMYGRDVFLRDAADEVMDKLYRQALEQEDITPVGEPEVEINALEPVNFVVSVPVYPTIDVKDYAGVRVEPQDAAMDDSEIDEVLGRLQRSQSEWVEVADDVKPGEHDQVTVDYEVMLGDEPFQEPVTDAVFVLGETNLLAQLREKLEGLTKGESATFDIAFDEDDDTADPSIRGKSLAYTVTVKDIKRRELLPLDDDFAKKVNETETLEELRGQIAQDIHAGKTQEARTSVLNDIIEAMANQAEIDPPSVMVDEEVNHQLNHLKEDLQRSNTPWEGYLRLQDKTEDDIKEELRPVAESRLRNSLFLQEVGRKEEIAVTDEDIDGEINKMVGLSSNLGPEASEQATRMAELYRSDYFKNMIRSQLFEQKLTDRIIEIATEGKGAVLNGFVPPEPVQADVIEASSEVLADDTSTEEPAEAFTNTDGVPFDHVDGESTEVEVDAVAASDDDATTGAEASDDVPAGAVAGDGSATAPEGYPIKGNASSRIYHVPGGGSYDATIAEFHFATEEEAEAAGFRAAKR